MPRIAILGKYLAIAGFVLGVAAVIFALFAIYAFFAADDDIEISRLRSATDKTEFVLIDRFAGIGDFSWYVYEVEKGSKVSKDQTASRQKLLFSNYSEDGSHIDKEKLEIVKGRYLVFSRGDRYHSLYDMKTDKVVVNESSPFHAALAAGMLNSSHHDETKDTKAVDEWVRINLHEPILAILNSAPNQPMERTP
jgi:hypothetical protein